MPEQPHRQAPMDAHPQLDGLNLTTMDLDEAVGRRVSPRQRMLQIGGVAALLILVLAIVVYNLTRAQPPNPATAFHPAVLVSNVSFGAVTLNGAQLSGPPPIVLPLRQGANHITLSAPPFAPRSCQLRWGGSGLIDIGDCDAEGRHTTVTIGGRAITPDVLVALTLTADDLPPSAVAGARAAVTNALQATRFDPLTLWPGEIFATGGFYPAQVSTATVTDALQARLVLSMPLQSPDAPVPTTCSIALCAGTPLAAQPTTGGPEWAVALGAVYQWTYTDFQGRVVATSITYPLLPPAEMLLAYHRADNWSVVGAPSASAVSTTAYGTWAEKLCGAGANILLANTQALQGQATTLENLGLDGCELFLRASDGQAARFIWRCGVLLAADPLAHQFVPNVPVAPTAVAKLFTA